MKNGRLINSDLQRIFYNILQSLSKRIIWEQGVVGSNPAAPTKRKTVQHGKTEALQTCRAFLLSEHLASLQLTAFEFALREE
jgi:hypothetical protein